MTSTELPSTNPAQPSYILYTGAPGHPLEPYAGPLPSPEAAARQKSWEKAKLILHILAALTAVIGLALGLSLVRYPDSDVFLIGVSVAPPLVIALLWSLAEIITRAVRKWKSGIHPGAQVGMNLIIWLLAILLGVITGILAGSDSMMSNTCTGHPRWDDIEECEDQLGPAAPWRVAIAATTFCDLVAVLHFVLFVRACVDVHRRNRANAKPVIMVAHPQLAVQGWQPMQQAPQVSAA